MNVITGVYFACNEDTEVLNNTDNPLELGEFGKVQTKGLDFISNSASEEVSEDDRKATRDFLTHFLNTETSVYLNEDYELTNLQSSFVLALEMNFDREENFETLASLIFQLENKANSLLPEEREGLCVNGTRDGTISNYLLA